MRHRPHVYVPTPWDGPLLALPDQTRHHLERVLRQTPGDTITYTDGDGVGGVGMLLEAGVERGAEQHHPRPTPQLVIAVAPPHVTSRARTLVEKVAELGCDQLVWLSTAHGEGRPPRKEKGNSWAVAALEQSHGHYLLRIDGPVPMDYPWPEDYEVFVADSGGKLPHVSGASDADGVVILIGPEAGFAKWEVPDDAYRIRFAGNVLRVETAAIAAAGWLVISRRFSAGS